MILKTFVIYDSKVEAYNAPFCFPSRGQALRQFQDLANDRQSIIFKHAADFTLFEIGEFDDANAMVLIMDHINLGKAIEFQSAHLET